MSRFIADFHYEKPSEKLKPEWALKAVQYLWYNTNNRNLLAGKNIREIDEFYSGDIDMRRFIKLFKSLKKDLAKNGKLDNSKEFLKQMDISGSYGLEFNPLPMLTEKMNSAITVITKSPVEVTVNAVDALALEKKQRDINFIKNKALYEMELADVADKLGLDEPDLGTTENSSVEFSDSPFGLDLNEPDELEIFHNLIYSLKVESAFETALQAYYEIKNRKQQRILEVKDQLRYGVSVNSCQASDLTGLPECEYVHPSEMEVPYSDLPDFSDNAHRVRTKQVTVMDFMNMFGTEIGTKDQLIEIISGVGSGYCDMNGQSRARYENYDTMKVTLKQIEVKSVDWIGVAKTKSKKGYTFFTEDESLTEKKLWAQNTYTFWWLYNTKYVFGIKRLGWANRQKGNESIQSFTTNIYKSQELSAVELSIGSNIRAQIADIKLQHAVIMSLPAGRYIDLRYLRGALTALTDEADSNTMNELLQLALERNIMIGDTSGFDGKNDGQFKPVIELQGGLKSEIIGYMNIIAAANQEISRITGINQNLTGQRTEELIGLQQISIDSSINAIDYCKEALQAQDQKVFNHWANIIKYAVEQGGATKEAIRAIIGSRKASVIDGLDEIELHDLGVMVKVSPRREEQQFFLSQLGRLAQKGVLTAADEFMVTNIDNPKDKYAFLAVKEQKFLKRQDMIRQEGFAQQQQIMQQQGQNMLQKQQAVTQGELAVVGAKAEGQSRILQLAAELGIRASQIEGLIKSNLQRSRGAEQKDKTLSSLREKYNLENQESLI
jgi:hypothetical protein